MTRHPFDKFSRELRGGYLGHLSECGVWKRPVPQAVKCKDPDDPPFLDLAVSSDADFLVTRDTALLEIGQVLKTRILAPEDFLRELRSSKRSE